MGIDSNGVAAHLQHNQMPRRGYEKKMFETKLLKDASTDVDLLSLTCRSFMLIGQRQSKQLYGCNSPVFEKGSIRHTAAEPRPSSFCEGTIIFEIATICRQREGVTWLPRMLWRPPTLPSVHMQTHHRHSAFKSLVRPVLVNRYCAPASPSLREVRVVFKADCTHLPELLWDTLKHDGQTCKRDRPR